MKRGLLLCMVFAFSAAQILVFGRGRIAGAQDEIILPSRPKPVEGWQPPARSTANPGATLPQTQRVEEINPLTSIERLPQRVFGEAPKSEVMAPEEPPPTNTVAKWEDLLARTIRPVVLPTSRYLSIGGRGVSLREGPGLDFPRAGTLYEGDVVAHLDTDDDWHQIVDSDGTEGWVSSRYASPISQAASIVTAERVNLRDAPSIESRVLGSLYRGAVVIAEAPVGDWVQIRTPNLEQAFVARDFVLQLPDDLPPNLPLLEAPPTTGMVTSLSKAVAGATAETPYVLAVWGNEWVKGGKVGLLHFSKQAPTMWSGQKTPSPHITDGAFFEKTVPRRDFSAAFSEDSQFPEGTESVTVAYLRGKKKDRIWVFGFTFTGHGPEDRFALVCQEGPQTGRYLLLEDK